MSLSRAFSTIGDRLLGRLLPSVEASAQSVPVCGPQYGGESNGEVGVVWCCYWPDGESSCS